MGFTTIHCKKKDEENMEEKQAIIDIGSNSIRLAIYERFKGKIREVENVKVVARLRSYLDENKILTEAGKKILIDTLLSFQNITRHHRIENVRCVATATIRQAVNQAELVSLVSEKTDFTMRVISEYEEAYYGFLAVITSTSVTEGITIDLGGGSTEVTYFKNRVLLEYHSFPFGSVSLKKDFVAGDLPTQEELEKIKEFLDSQLQILPWLKNRKLPIVAIGGSARNLVKIHQALNNYPLQSTHQYEMDDFSIQEVQEHITSLPFEKLQQVQGLSSDRADIIIPAFTVFSSLYSVVRATHFILSIKGLRDGVFYDEFIRVGETMLLPSEMDEKFYELGKDYDVNIEHVLHTTQIATELFEHFRCKGLYSPLGSSDIADVKRAAQVFYLGQYVDGVASSQHTFYILTHRTIESLRHIERVKLALLASFKNKTTFKQYIEPFSEWFTPKERRKILFLGALLKFAYSLDGTKQKIVRHSHLEDNGKVLRIHLYCTHQAHMEKLQAEKHKKHLEKAVKRNIELCFHYHRQETAY